MDRDWNLRSYVLETIDFSIDLTSKNVAAGFVNVTEARDIKKEKVVAFVTDYAANIRKAVGAFLVLIPSSNKRYFAKSAT